MWELEQAPRLDLTRRSILISCIKRAVKNHMTIEIMLQEVMGPTLPNVKIEIIKSSSSSSKMRTHPSRSQ